MEQLVKKLIEGEQDPVGKLLSTMSRDWRSLLDERMKPFGMNGSRWTVLLALHILEEPTIQSVLAKVVGVQGSTLVNILDGMEEKGLVRRLPHPGDRRVNRVDLCAKGKRLTDKLFDVAKSLEEEILTVLPKKRRESLRDDLLKIRSRIHDLSGRS